MMGKPHVIAIPCPAQGHVIPLLEVTQYLAENGVRVTFVNTDFNHERIIKAQAETGNVSGLIRLVSIPDGLEPGEDRNDLGRLTDVMVKVMPQKLEALIENTKETEGDEVMCILTDYYMAWALDVAAKFGVKKAAFSPVSIALSASTINASKLVQDGIIDSNGRPLEKQGIRLSPGMPEMNPMNFTWACIGDPTAQKIVFHAIIDNNKSLELADMIICNSSHHLEPGALAYLPNCLPIGPLLASNRLGKPAGHFWPEDTTSLTWLDQQLPNSVVYVAFGSYTVFDQTQFQELALGLELTNRPFLWVVRRDISSNTLHTFPEGYENRTEKRGKMVGWAPQQEVLSHPSIGCFISHCGWNSTMEGVANGVPFLCWPYFADQFLNESYICDEWKIGLRLSKDESGIIKGGEIRDKVDCLLDDEMVKERVVHLQEKVMDSFRRGCSSQNLKHFLDWINKD